MREPDRKIDVTLCIHLAGDDTRSEAEAVVERLRERLDGMVLQGPRGHGYMRVVSTDDPIHLHTVQRGSRV